MLWFQNQTLSWIKWVEDGWWYNSDHGIGKLDWMCQAICDHNRMRFPNNFESKRVMIFLIWLEDVPKYALKELFILCNLMFFII